MKKSGNLFFQLPLLFCVFTGVFIIQPETQAGNDVLWLDEITTLPDKWLEESLIEKNYSSIVSYTIPAGTLIRVRLLEPISTETAQSGQTVETRISQTMYSGNEILLTPKDRVIGFINKSVPAKQGQNGIISFTFESLLLDNKLSYCIDTTAVTYQDKPFFGGEGTIGTQPERVPYRLYQVANYNRVALRGPRATGQEIVFEPGDEITLRLNETIQIIRR